MLNKTFSSFNKFEKQAKLERVLISKQRKITSEQLQAIFNEIDVHQQYVIKGLSSAKKFKNMIVNENIHTSDKQVYSETKLIYGEFVPGLYKNVDNNVTNIVSVLNPLLPAAAVKRTEIISNGVKAILHSLILYAPEKGLEIR